MENIFEDHFGVLPDPRVERTKKHKLLDIIAIAMCGVLSGADNWVEIEEFGQIREAWLREFLELPNGIPSHDTFGRVFARLDADAFRRSFIDWVRAVHRLTAGQVVAIDGKTLRGSVDKTKGKAALHVVSAWASENALVLGQLAVEDKSNEITAIPQLLEMLVLQGCIVTSDRDMIYCRNRLLALGSSEYPSRIQLVSAAPTRMRRKISTLDQGLDVVHCRRSPDYLPVGDVRAYTAFLEFENTKNFFSG